MEERCLYQNTSIHYHTLLLKNRENVNFLFFVLRGFVLIIVNIVTGGYAQRNIAELNILQEKYYDKGLRILAFPCDQFSKRVRICSILYL